MTKRRAAGISTVEVLDGLGRLEDAFEAMAMPISDGWRPIIVRLAHGELERFSDFCRRRRLRMIDEFRRQLLDLATARLPAASDAEREQLVDERIEGAGGAAYAGNWILFPWEHKAVHLLDEEDFIEVITNRNRDKITWQEQEILRTKAVGVMGLSLGAEAAATVAQEHLCGHLVIADFDRLDLSNLNRINAGVDDLGLPKTTIAARRIAKIDPYLRVTVLEDGVTDGNADRFLDGLDLLIEECDGMKMKLDIRLKAKERGINVVFAGDERGFLSVEPYGLEPELPPFHGRIQEAEPPREGFVSKREFFVELSEWLGGWSNVSERTRLSLEQVGDALCGYPQLASEARLAAAQVGHVARRLLLGEKVAPFLGYIDLDEIVHARDGGATSPPP